MPTSANGEPHFQLDISGSIAEVLRQLQRQASREGRGKAFLAAVRKAIDRLRRDATAFGESIYRLPALRLQVRLAVVGPLGIHFAVHEDRPLVFIKSVKLL
jgi:hypothetical protein